MLFENAVKLPIHRRLSLSLSLFLVQREVVMFDYIIIPARPTKGGPRKFPFFGVLLPPLTFERMRMSCFFIKGYNRHPHSSLSEWDRHKGITWIQKGDDDGLLLFARPIDNRITSCPFVTKEKPLTVGSHWKRKVKLGLLKVINAPKM